MCAGDFTARTPGPGRRDEDKIGGRLSVGAASTTVDLLRPGERLVMIAGNYGSGKTEVSVNLAIHLSAAGHRVQIADLDIVNPYFRCREAGALMERHGIRVVVPPGAQVWADLPIILPEIRGMLHPPEGTVSIFDVGGDDVGARALSAFRPSVGAGGYELWQVVNSRRPFTGTLDGCLAMRRALEAASRFEVTGLVANSHLIDETTPDAVLEGWRLASEVSEKTGLPVRAVAVMDEMADLRELAVIDAPVLRLERYMLPPWLQRDETGEPAPRPVRLPAGRPVPLGKAGPIRLDRFEGDPDGQNRD